jgi:hypothetical protein
MVIIQSCWQEGREEHLAYHLETPLVFTIRKVYMFHHGSIGQKRAKI